MDGVKKESRVGVSDVLALLFVAYFVLLPGISPYIDKARPLEVPAASLFPFYPFLFLGGALIFMALGTRVRRPWYRALLSAAALLIFLVWPFVLFHSYTTSIPLPRWLTDMERERVKQIFPHPFSIDDLSGGEIGLRVRRGEESEALTAYIASLPKSPTP